MNSKIKELVIRTRREAEKWDKWQRERDHEVERMKRYRAEIKANLTSYGKESKYRKWLKGYLGNGGSPTHYYDRPLGSDFYVATGNIIMQPLFGAMSLNIIVPPEYEVEGALGHVMLYFLKDFTCKGHGWVPIYSNTIV